MANMCSVCAAWGGRDRLVEVGRRGFATPGFAGVEFIELNPETVINETVINQVKGSGFPFTCTLNPCRGCTHVCVYCFARAEQLKLI